MASSICAIFLKRVLVGITGQMGLVLKVRISWKSSSLQVGGCSLGSLDML